MMSDIGDGEGAPSSAAAASGKSKSLPSTAAPAPHNGPAITAVDSGGGYHDDCGPKTFSNTTGLEVEVPQAVTQRIANHQCEQGLLLAIQPRQGFVLLAEIFLRTSTRACQPTIAVAQAKMTRSS